MNNFREMLNILRLFRLHSRYYINFSYFTLFSVIVLCYSRYIVFNHITPIKIVVLVLALLILVIIPLGFVYYIIRSCISAGKIVKKQYDENYTNKYIWLSDSIYILLMLYVVFINYVLVF